MLWRRLVQGGLWAAMVLLHLGGAFVYGALLGPAAVIEFSDSQMIFRNLTYPQPEIAHCLTTQTQDSENAHALPCPSRLGFKPLVVQGTDMVVMCRRKPFAPPVQPSISTPRRSSATFEFSLTRQLPHFVFKSPMHENLNIVSSPILPKQPSPPPPRPRSCPKKQPPS